MMQVINTFGNVLDCFTDCTFDITAWRNYTKTFSEELCKKCENDASEYNFNEEVLPVSNNILNDKDKFNTKKVLL